jgi:hypothetical protein
MKATTKIMIGQPEKVELHEQYFQEILKRLDDLEVKRKSDPTVWERIKGRFVREG